MNNWMSTWHKNNYIRDEEEIPNASIIKYLHILSKSANICARWVKSHSGNKYNDRADVLANISRKKL